MHPCVPKSTRIKREYPIDVFASLYLQGGKTRANAALYVCPHHGDTVDSPNLEVYRPGHKKYGSCKCWRCGFGGTVIDLAMEVFGVPTPGEAMTLIEGKSGLDQKKRAGYAARSRRYAELEARRPTLNGGTHIHTLIDWAADNLAHDDAAVRYLASRGLGGAAAFMSLGSSTGMPADVLPQAWDGERGAVYPMRSFRDRIVIPYLRPDGLVRYCNARAFADTDKGKKYRKPADVAPEPYLLDCALLEGEDLVLTEGEFDCLSLIVAMRDDPIGFFAVPGLRCFTEDDARKLAGRRVLIVTDNDDAGREGRQTLEEMVGGYAQQVRHLHVTPPYGDVNDLLAACGRRVLRQWLLDAGHAATGPRRRFL